MLVLVDFVANASEPEPAFEPVVEPAATAPASSASILAVSDIEHDDEMRGIFLEEAREVVPPDRAQRAWVLRWNRRVGNVWSRVHLELAESRGELLRTWVTLTARGTVRVARGVVLTAWGRVTADVGRRATGECHVAAGLGVLGGATGRVVTEYLRSSV